MGGLSDIIVTTLVQVWTGGRDVVFVLVVLMGEYKSVVLSVQEEVGEIESIRTVLTRPLPRLPVTEPTTPPTVP